MKLEAKLSELIKVKTISNYDELNVFPAFHKKIEEVFPTFFSNVELEIHHGAMLMKWSGKNHDERVLFMNHHDVVDATGEWKFDPFAGKIEEGKVWGRGAIDTKGGLCCMIEAAEQLMKEGFVPDCDIYFFSDSQEETNGNGARYVSQIFLDQGLRFKYVLDEGGVVTKFPIEAIKGKFAMVGVEEKGCADFRFVINSNGGHSSTPEKNTPLVVLGKFMTEVDRKNLFKREITDTLKEMFRRLSKNAHGPLKVLIGHPTLFEPLLKVVLPSLSPTMNALVRTTICFTQAEGSNQDNVIPEHAYVLGNMRYSNHQGYESSIAEVEVIANKYGIKTERVDQPERCAVTDFRSEGFKLLERSLEKSFKNVPAVPYQMNGASDSRFFTKNSDVVMRFVPFDVTEEQVESIHGLNECVDISTLYDAVEFYKNMMMG